MKRKSNGHTDDYLKRQAKDIQKQEKISYLQALEKAAKNAGFNNWNHFINSSKSDVTPSKEKVDNLNQPDYGESNAINPYRNLLVAGWLERKTGKYIQGKNNESIFDRYIRKGEKAELEKLPLQKTKRFKTEGKFHF